MVALNIQKDRAWVCFAVDVGRKYFCMGGVSHISGDHASMMAYYNELELHHSYCQFKTFEVKHGFQDQVRGYMKESGVPQKHVIMLSNMVLDELPKTVGLKLWKRLTKKPKKSVQSGDEKKAPQVSKQGPDNRQN